MTIRRINNYTDARFSHTALLQHGAFLVDETPCEVIVTGASSACVHCPDAEAMDALINEFRFYAEHITHFTDASGRTLRTFPPVERFPVALADIQPSQFFVDEDKLDAVLSFIHAPEDAVIPLIRHGDRFISLDGHTRMYAAHRLGFDHVTGFIANHDDVILRFAEEAVCRGVRTPDQLELLSHEAYVIRWDGFCDRFFSNQP